MRKDRSLKRIGLYILAGMFLIFLTEYIIIRYKIEVLEEVEEKKDYARGAQLAGQQIALLVQEYLNEQSHLSTEIISRIDQQDHVLKVLREGGRMDGTDVFLKPLSRLPRITFRELEETWVEYKTNVLAVVLPENQMSSGSVVSSENPEGRIRTLLQAQSLTLGNWYKRLEADLTEEADRKKNAVETWVFAFIFFDLILLAFLFYLFNRFVIKPILTLRNNTQGQHQDFEYPQNEIGHLTHEVNEVLEQLKDATDFVTAIGEGKLDFDYKVLDGQYAQGRNRLADSLISMQRKLKDMNMEEQRRQWANEGLTKFVDILRTSNNNINSLGDEIISALVQYTGSNQGGLYIFNDENENEKFLELISLFAFDTKKFEKQKIRLGEGILGQAFLEKETTILTEIPEEYVRITSGLGDANPKALLIVPLKVDDQVYGLVELASFKHYQQHEIAFVEKLGETIASTLASVKVAQKNRDLIEQFQQQTEQMRAQEEEVRQNMEELQATQEEMGRKERDYIARIHELETSSDNSAAAKEITRLKEAFSGKEAAYQQQLHDLKNKVTEKLVKAEDWELAEEIGKTLAVQMEALRISREEFREK